MTADDTDDLAGLLELADGERPLPPGLEAQILADVLETARQPRAAPGDAPATLPAPAEITLADADGRERSRRRTGRVLTWVAAAAAVVLVAAGVVAAGRVGGPAPAQRPTTAVTTVAPAPTTSAPSLGGLSDDEVCAALARSIGAAGLAGQPTPAADLDPHVLDEVVAVVTEAGRRPLSVDAAIVNRLRVDVVPLVEYVALELRQGTPAAAQAAYTEATVAAAFVLDRWPSDPCLHGS